MDGRGSSRVLLGSVHQALLGDNRRLVSRWVWNVRWSYCESMSQWFSVVLRRFFSRFVKGVVFFSVVLIRFSRGFVKEVVFFSVVLRRFPRGFRFRLQLKGIAKSVYYFRFLREFKASVTVIGRIKGKNDIEKLIAFFSRLNKR